jgi:hypothetical protein
MADDEIMALHKQANVDHKYCHSRASLYQEQYCLQNAKSLTWYSDLVNLGRAKQDDF